MAKRPRFNRETVGFRQPDDGAEQAGRQSELVGRTHQRLGENLALDRFVSIARSALSMAPPFHRKEIALIAFDRKSVMSRRSRPATRSAVALSRGRPAARRCRSSRSPRPARPRPSRSRGSGGVDGARRERQRRAIGGELAHETVQGSRRRLDGRVAANDAGREFDAVAGADEGQLDAAGDEAVALEDEVARIDLDEDDAVAAGDIDPAAVTRTRPSASLRRCRSRAERLLPRRRRSAGRDGGTRRRSDPRSQRRRSQCPPG